MRLPSRLAAAAAALLLPLSGLAAQDDFAEVKVEPQAVAGAVHALFGAGGNLGLSTGPDGVLLIDDQFAPLSGRILAAIDALAPGETPRLLLNTHWHGDHTGGNAALGARPPAGPGALILAQANVRLRLLDPPAVAGRPADPPAPPAALPVITWEDGLTLHWNGEDVRVIHLPHAHTDGDSIAWFTGSGVAHLGDLFFSGRFPYVDIDSGGDVVGLTAAIDRLLAILPAGTKLIPGHGPVSNMDDLRTFRRMLVETQAIVAERLAAGMDDDAIVAAGLPEEWSGWAWQFISEERWLRLLAACARHGEAAHAALLAPAGARASTPAEAPPGGR